MIEQENKIAACEVYLKRKKLTTTRYCTSVEDIRLNNVGAENHSEVMLPWSCVCPRCGYGVLGITIVLCVSVVYDGAKTMWSNESSHTMMSHSVLYESSLRNIVFE